MECRQRDAALTSKAITSSSDRWSKLLALDIRIGQWGIVPQDARRASNATPKVMICTRDCSVLRLALRVLPLEDYLDKGRPGGIDRAPE